MRPCSLSRSLISNFSTVVSNATPTATLLPVVQRTRVVMLESCELSTDGADAYFAEDTAHVMGLMLTHLHFVWWPDVRASTRVEAALSAGCRCKRRLCDGHQASEVNAVSPRFQCHV